MSRTHALLWAGINALSGLLWGWLWWRTSSPALAALAFVAVLVAAFGAVDCAGRAWRGPS